MARRPNKDADEKRRLAREAIAEKAKALAAQERQAKWDRTVAKRNAKKKVAARHAAPATSTSSTPTPIGSAPAPAARVNATGADAMKEREYEIARLCALALPHAEIVRRMARKHGLAESWTYTVIKKCYAHWQKIAQEDEGRDSRRARMRDTLGVLMDRALSIMDVKTAVVAADRLAKLDGLYAPEKIDIGDGTIAQSEPDRVRGRIRDLVQKHADKIGLRLPPGLVSAPKTEEAPAMVAVEPSKTATN